MADNWRSKLITAGIARSPNRAMLRAVGFGDDGLLQQVRAAVARLRAEHLRMHTLWAALRQVLLRWRDDAARTALSGCASRTGNRWRSSSWWWCGPAMSK